MHHAQEEMKSCCHGEEKEHSQHHGCCCGGQKEKCPACKGQCGGDPFTCAMIMWKFSFFQAIRDTQVETLKSKMKSTWGPKMEKAADIIFETMSNQWQAMMTEAKVKEELKTKLRAFWAGQV